MIYCVPTGRKSKGFAEEDDSGLRPQRRPYVYSHAYLGRCPLSSARPNKRNVVCTQ